MLDVEHAKYCRVVAGSFGLFQEENATDRSDWNRKPIEQISGISTIQNGGGGIFEYLPYTYHPKMDSENEQSSHQVKTRRFVLDNKHKCQTEINHFSIHVSLCASAILFRKLCRPFQISSGRDGRASKAEVTQSKALELFFQFRQLYRWPKRTDYLSIPFL